MKNEELKLKERNFFDHAKEISWLKCLQRESTARMVWDKEVRFVSRNFCDKKVVLDIGCGDLRYTSLWKSFGARCCIGCDISSGFMKYGMSNKIKRVYKYKINTGPDFCIQGDCEALPFKAGSFDSVFVFHLLHHLKEQKNTMEEVSRVLKSDGYVIISEVNGRHPFRKIASFFGKKAGLLTEDENPLSLSRIIEALPKNFRIKKIFYTSPLSVVVFNTINVMSLKNLHPIATLLRLFLPFAVFLDGLMERSINIPRLFWRVTIIAQKTDVP